MQKIETELQHFLTGIDQQTAGQTGSRATFLVRELAELVGISNRDVIDMMRTEADYYLDGKWLTHGQVVRLLDGQGDVEIEVFRRGDWQLSLAVALGVLTEEAINNG